MIFDPADVRVLTGSTAERSARAKSPWSAAGRKKVVDQPPTIDRSQERRGSRHRQRETRHFDAGESDRDGGRHFIRINPGGNCIFWRVGIPTATEHPTGLHFHYIHQLIEAGGTIYCLGDGNDSGRGVVDRGPFRALKISFASHQARLTVARSQHYGWWGGSTSAANGPFAEDFNFYRIEIAKPVRDWLAELQTRR